MKILVTGANGLVGRACQRNLQNYDAEVILISRKSPLFRNFKWFKSFEEFSIQREYQEIDLLIHCSAATPNNTISDDIFNSNRKIDNQLVKMASKKDIKHIVYLSTMAIYGEIESKTISEKNIPNKPTPYGLSKYIGEEQISTFASIKDIKSTILRLPGVVGQGMPNIFFKRCFRDINEGKLIKIQSKNSLFNNAVLDEDILKTCLNCFELQKEKNTILNQHSKDTVKLIEFLELIANYLNKDLLFYETDECNPPFIIKNQKNDSLIITRNIKEMIMKYSLVF